MNLIENLIKNAGNNGISIKQLKSKTSLSKRNIKYFIHHSNNISDINPLTHGSCKRKINVFTFNPSAVSYNFKKNFKDKKKVNIELELIN